jgi:hypothetical protein
MDRFRDVVHSGAWTDYPAERARVT